MKCYADCIIIGHSSDDSEDIIQGFLEAGANQFEKKPTTYKNLNEIIQEYLELFKPDKNQTTMYIYLIVESLMIEIDINGILDVVSQMFVGFKDNIKQNALESATYYEHRETELIYLYEDCLKTIAFATYPCKDILHDVSMEKLLTRIVDFVDTTRTPYNFPSLRLILEEMYR